MNTIPPSPTNGDGEANCLGEEGELLEKSLLSFKLFPPGEMIDSGTKSKIKLSALLLAARYTVGKAGQLWGQGHSGRAWASDPHWIGSPTQALHI